MKGDSVIVCNESSRINFTSRINSKRKKKTILMRTKKKQIYVLTYSHYTYIINLFNDNLVPLKTCKT